MKSQPSPVSAQRPRNGGVSAPSNASGGARTKETSVLAAAKIVLHPLTYLSVPNIIYAILGIFVWYSGLYPLETANGLLQTHGLPHNLASPSGVTSLLAVHWKWMFGIVTRNMAMTFVVYTCWHTLLYETPGTSNGGGNPAALTELNETLSGFGFEKLTKFNPAYPPKETWGRDRRMTLFG